MFCTGNLMMHVFTKGVSVDVVNLWLYGQSKSHNKYGYNNWLVKEPMQLREQYDDHWATTHKWAKQNMNFRNAENFYFCQFLLKLN